MGSSSLWSTSIDWYEDHYFGYWDYTVFAGMLLLSAMTGVYFGMRGRVFKKSEKPTLKDYLIGSGNMRAFPVAMSLTASYVSGVTVLGTPAEIYSYGSQYWLIAVSIVLMGITVSLVYIPVFVKLKLRSSYEYLELRFDRRVRLLASVLFVLDEVIFLPIIIYVPSLALNQVSNANLYMIGVVVGITCVFYTVLGGLKAVVWTDTWQIIVMFISVVVVVIIGSITIEGPQVVFQRSAEGGRIIFGDINPSPYARNTVWSVLIGGYTYWTAFNSVNQTMVQRYLALPTLRECRKSMMIYTTSVALFISMCCYCGLLVYASYYACDLKSAGQIQSMDQLLPMFVMQTVGRYHGVAGLFIAGVFGAALSSLSVVLNSTSVVLLEDFLQGFRRQRLSERQSTIFVKTVVLVLGFMAIVCVLVVERLGGILSAASSLTAIAAGTSCGVFSLGMLVPFANAKGALWGGIVGGLTAGLVSFGSNLMAALNWVVARPLEMRTDGCYDLMGVNVTTVVPEYPDESSIFFLFRLSYHWITPIGVVTVMVVGSVVSWLTGGTDPTSLDPDLFSPVVQCLLPPESAVNVGSSLKKLVDLESTSTQGDMLMNDTRPPHYEAMGKEA